MTHGAVVFCLKKKRKAMEFYQFSTSVVLLMLAVFYGGTYLMTRMIRKEEENTDAYMVANERLGIGFASSSMTATWIWAASFYAAATSGYKYGVSGPLHYGLWGALMILFIYPFGQRFRKLAPKAHTLGELIHARHGSSSQLILAISNVLGSSISLMVNFTAAGALVAVLSPLSFQTGVIIAGVGVLSYTLWSGFRAAVFTDVAQLVALMAVAVVIIPAVFFAMGGAETFVAGLSSLTSEQQSFFSREAILEQGAPYFFAVLAYAVGNQTISQRLFAVDEAHIKPTFITATLGYGAIVIGLGMIGLLALAAGIQPVDGDTNNLIPQVVSTYLSPVMVALFFVLVIGSLSSTADSDLCALSAIMMADVYGKNIAKDNPNPERMLLIGRITMIVATMVGIVFASFKLDILVMLVFVGALWGTIVFPVIASVFWNKVTNAAFTWSVVIAMVMFCLVRFELLPMTGALAYAFEAIGALGAAVVVGLMAFAFLGVHLGVVFAVIGGIVALYINLDFMRDHTVLLASLTGFGVSTLVCTVMSLLSSQERFDFNTIGQEVQSYDS